MQVAGLHAELGPRHLCTCRLPQHSSGHNSPCPPGLTRPQATQQACTTDHCAPDLTTIP